MKRIEVYVVQLHMSVLILGERMEKTFFEKMVKLFELLASVCTITGASIWGIVTYMNSERNELVSEVPADEKIDENMEEDSILAMAEHVVENSAKINRNSPYLSITLHKCYPYYLFGISTFPNSAYHSIALRKFSITIV